MKHDIHAKAPKRRGRKPKNASEQSPKAGRSRKPKRIPPNGAEPSTATTPSDGPVLRPKVKLHAIAQKIKKLVQIEGKAGIQIKDLTVLRQKIGEDIGRLGLDAKQILGHGKLLEWFDGQDLGISYTTFGRFMRMAKKSLVINFPSDASLSQAYSQLGIKMEAKTDLPKKGEVDLRRTKPYTEANFVAGVKGKTADIKAAFDIVQFDTFDPAGLDKLSTGLAELIAACTALKVKVEDARRHKADQASVEGQPELPLTEPPRTPPPSSNPETDEAPSNAA